MIRFLQKDSRIIKGVFVAIIGLAVITMVITLVPGVFQDASATTDTYATVRSGFPARLYEPSTNIKESEVQQTASRQMQQQRIPEAYLPYLLPRAMQQAAQQLIQKALILREADRLGMKATDEDVRDGYREQNTKIKFDYAVLNSDEVRKQINPTDGELQDFFKKSASRYATAVPEARKIQYVAFNESQVGNGACSSAGQIAHQ